MGRSENFGAQLILISRFIKVKWPIEQSQSSEGRNIMVAPAHSTVCTVTFTNVESLSIPIVSLDVSERERDAIINVPVWENLLSITKIICS